MNGKHQSRVSANSSQKLGCLTQESNRVRLRKYGFILYKSHEEGGDGVKVLSRVEKSIFIYYALCCC